MSGYFDPPCTFNIPVVGGNGYYDLECWGIGEIVYVSAPQAGTTWVFEVDSPTGKQVRLVPGITDDLLSEKEFPLRGVMRFKVTGSNHDGVFPVELTWRPR